MMLDTEAVSMDSEPTTPRIFISEDTQFSRMRLSSIVEEAGCEVVQSTAAGGDLCHQLESVGAPVSLIVVPLYPDPPAQLDAIGTLRRRDWLKQVPILAISPLDQSGLDLSQLRVLGVAGVIDKRALPEHVRFRLSQVVYQGPNGRRFERAPCCIPVELDVSGEVRTEYAISLSIAGMGLASSRKITPNTPVKLRFMIGSPEDQLVEAEGRAVHIRPSQREGADFEVGVFFYPLAESACGAIQAEVNTLLATWASVSRMDLEKQDDPA